MVESAMARCRSRSAKVFAGVQGRCKDWVLIIGGKVVEIPQVLGDGGSSFMSIRTVVSSSHPEYQWMLTWSGQEVEITMALLESGVEHGQMKENVCSSTGTVGGWLGHGLSYPVKDGMNELRGVDSAIGCKWSRLSVLVLEELTGLVSQSGIRMGEVLSMS